MSDVTQGGFMKILLMVMTVMVMFANILLATAVSASEISMEATQVSEEIETVEYWILDTSN